MFTNLDEQMMNAYLLELFSNVKRDSIRIYVK